MGRLEKALIEKGKVVAESLVFDGRNLREVSEKKFLDKNRKQRKKLEEEIGTYMIVNANLLSVSNQVKDLTPRLTDKNYTNHFYPGSFLDHEVIKDFNYAERVLEHSITMHTNYTTHKEDLSQDMEKFKKKYISGENVVFPQNIDQYLHLVDEAARLSNDASKILRGYNKKYEEENPEYIEASKKFYKQLAVSGVGTVAMYVAIGQVGKLLGRLHLGKQAYTVGKKLIGK